MIIQIKAPRAVKICLKASTYHNGLALVCWSGLQNWHNVTHRRIPTVINVSLAINFNVLSAELCVIHIPFAVIFCLYIRGVPMCLFSFTNIVRYGLIVQRLHKNLRPNPFYWPFSVSWEDCPCVYLVFAIWVNTVSRFDTKWFRGLETQSSYRSYTNIYKCIRTFLTVHL